ncbi:MAG: FeoB-associated Cys-rich membrane protein [Ruminococcaceae bacterium]|nr:FeoB-associated Cys-rich membrane protein [Oscillospiraceae bacterium]
MLNWISTNLPTIAILLVLVGVLTAIVMNMIKNKRAGKSSCSCGCEGCANRGSCHGN